MICDYTRRCIVLTAQCEANPFIMFRLRDTSFQKQKKQSIRLLFALVAGVGFEPHDLRVMSPTSYQAALPRDIRLSL